MPLQQSWLSLQQQIHQTARSLNKDPNKITILPVTKKQSITTITELITQGQHHFAENYLQEAVPKILALAHTPAIWHFIGAIQSNKTQKLATHFSWLHSVSSLAIAERLNTQRPSNLPPLNICLQINTSTETTKSGLNPADILPLAKKIQTLPNLKLRGIMAQPIRHNSFPEQKAAFQPALDCFNFLNNAGFSLDTLSMGTTTDWQAAIAMDATLLRIGTMLFGARAN
jgi:pyridoxal phosphate enzyme (YggS family)